MPNIKAYQNIHPEDVSLSFNIKRMEDIYDLTKGQADEPHRHAYYTIVLVKSAKGKHIIDFQEFELSAQQVYFVSPGQVHQIVESERSLGYALTFSPQFMLENGIDVSFIEDLHLFQDFGYSPPLELEMLELEKLVDLAEEIYDFAHGNQKFKYQAVGALLKLFLIHCNQACSLSKEENTQTVQASVSLLRNFKDLLNKNYKNWHKVSEYANALHITADYLNASVRSLTGKTAKEHIQSRIIIAAKRLLRFSDLQNKEIAYELGFSAPANFSQFFKKCTKVSPSEFRQI
ncbi:MAG: helix-turn-helix transcriptional regulator [Bacteroidota bacterium]